LRHRLEYLLVASVAFCVRHLPWRLISIAGGALGAGFYALDASRRRVTLDNLARAFPGRPASERRSIARRVFRHFGGMLLEVLKFSGLTADQMLSRVEFEGTDRARQAYAAGRGVFFLTAHFGCWEVNGIVHALHLAPIGLMARPLDNPLLNDMLERARQCTGNWVIYRKGGIRRTMRALESGQGVAMLIDQHIHGPDATRVDFFNRPAATTTALAALALRTGAPIIPVFAVPTAPGRYRMIYEHAVELPPPGSPDPVRELTQRCTDVLEMYVRRYPELWLWMHRRWRDTGTAATPTTDAVPPAVADIDPDSHDGEV
jgi:Kdo2-lipid IVA lauroyltransferase/acyltransferase